MTTLYRLDLSPLEDGDCFDAFLDRTSPARREKIARAKMREDKIRLLGAGILLDFGLRPYGKREAAMTYVYGEYGKPAFSDLPLGFSLSHAGRFALAAFSDAEVGCDIEKIGTYRDAFALRVLSPAEADEARDDPAAFFRFWTLKESYMKYTGKGLALPPASFTVARDGDAFTVAGTGLRLYAYTSDGYAAACCTIDDRPPLTDVTLRDLL